MDRLHESSPMKYPAPPKGLQGARSSGVCEDVALRWWEHVHPDEAPVPVSSKRHTLQSAEAEGLYPVQRAARPVIGTPGDMVATKKMLGDPNGGVNQYFPPDCRPYVEAPANANKADPLNMMGHPYNAKAVVQLAKFNFWKGSDKKHPADCLNGDKGKTQARAAEVDKARQDNDVEQERILAAAAAAADLEERAVVLDEEDDDDAADEVVNDTTGRGVWVINPNTGQDVCGTLVAKFPNGSAQVLLKGKGTAANRTITVATGGWSSERPQLCCEDKCDFADCNPHLQCINPTDCLRDPNQA